MNAICNEPISNRDPRYAGAMAELETDYAREDFLAYQRANFMRLAKLFLIDRDCEFEAFSWQQYAEARRCAYLAGVSIEQSRGWMNRARDAKLHGDSPETICTLVKIARARRRDYRAHLGLALGETS